MKAIKAEQDELAEQEERRIFYVAMTRAQSRLIVSGAVDAGKWDAPKPLGAPMDWVGPALAPGAKLLFERMADGIDDGVRCVLLSAETVDEVLPAGDRAPHRPGAQQAAIDAERPTFAPLSEGVPLPVARLSYSALESYKRCGYRFYLERVVKMPRARGALVADEAPSENGDQLSLAAAPMAPDAMSPLVRGTIVHDLP